MAKPLAEISKCRLFEQTYLQRQTSYLQLLFSFSKNQHSDYKQNDMASFTEALMYKDPTKSERNLFSVSVDFLSEHYGTHVWQFWLDVWHVKVCFLFGDKKTFKLRNLPSKTSTLFLSRRSACLFFWTAIKSATIVLKESTLLKGNLCIYMYKCFIDVLYIFDRVFKKNWEMRPIWDRWINSIVNFCYVLSWFYLWERIHDPVRVTSIAFNGKLMSFRIKIFKKQFVC